MTDVTEIDATGLLCPWPVLKLQKTLRDQPPGALVRVAATDAMAQIDVPHFCAENGHALLETTSEGAVTFFLVRRA